MQNTQESKTRINKIVRACRLISRMSKAQSEQLESHRIYYQMLADYYTRLMNAERDGDFVYFMDGSAIFRELRRTSLFL
ncbi:MAG: hypothetical protein P8105_04335 [Dehalococcoidia bacterium]